MFNEKLKEFKALEESFVDECFIRDGWPVMIFRKLDGSVVEVAFISDFNAYPVELYFKVLKEVL